MPFSTRIKFDVLSLLSLLLLSACTTTPDTYSSVAPGVDFRGIKTYGFLEQLSTDSAGYQSMETNFLKTAVAQQLDLRGMHHDPENPDVRMNFYIHTDEKIRTTQTPTMGGGYYGYRGSYYTGYGYGAGYQTQVDQYTEGTLTIDMVDPVEKKLLWEGTLKGRLTKKATEDMEATVNQAVAEIFYKFPVLDVTVQQ